MSSRKRSKDQPNECKKVKKRQTSSEESSDEEYMSDTEIQVDFSGFELAPEDYNGIKLLLQWLLLKKTFDLPELINYIIDQRDIGCVIKETEIAKESEETEDDIVYGLTTVITLKPSQELKFVDQLKLMFLELSEQNATQQTRSYLYSILNESTSNVGLIIHERYLNLPPLLSIPSFTKLKFEIEELSKKDRSYRFTHFIKLCKLYKTPINNKKNPTNEDFEITWCNPEDEVIDKLADARFEFSVSGDSDSGLSGSWTNKDQELLPFRRVLAFTAPKLEEIVNELEQLVP